MENKKKICIVGPGIMPIPPVGWGASEIIIDDKRKILESLGHEVLIINTKNLDEIIVTANLFQPDFIHIEYDVFVDIIPYLTCKNVAITSHYGYIERPEFWDYMYYQIFNKFLQSSAKIFSLSDGISNVYRKFGLSESRNFVIPNGVRDDLFRFEQVCENPDKSICVAKIEPRKRQYLFSDLPNVYFVGEICDRRFQSENHLGSWSKAELYENLTKYANLVLLSDGEAHPLVCVEALSAGLGIVVSEWGAANLDLTKDFIDVIPEDKINDMEFVKFIIDKNRQKSISMRDEIREYAITNFSWKKIITQDYLPKIFSNI